MKSFLNALRFLTVIPLPAGRDITPAELTSSANYYPLVGITLGLITAAVCFLTNLILPDLAGSVVTILALVLITGGFHLDGLADTADGFFSSRSPERMLEIMKDSRSGAMGVIAIAAVLMLKASALNGVPENLRWRAALLFPIAGRCAMIYMLNMLPYARSEAGLGSLFYQRTSWRAMTLAFFTLLICALGVIGLQGLIIVMLVLLTTVVFTWYTRRKIKGGTGDTAGAVCELAEAVALLGFAAITVT